jgi:hypothetical protein
MNNQKKIDKINNPDTTFHILDYGKNSWYYWNNRKHIVNGEFQKAEKVSEEFVLSLPDKLDGENDIIASEYAHFAPRTRKSKAQPLAATKILDIGEKCREKEIPFFLFPQDITTKLLMAYQYCVDPKAKKGDEHDPYYLYWNLKRNPNLITGTSTIPERSFEQPTIEDKRNGIVDSDTKSFFPERVEKIKTYRKRVNSILNAARMEEYSVANPEEDPNTKWLLDNYEEIKSNLSENARNVLGFVEAEHVHYPRYINKNGIISWASEDAKGVPKFMHIAVFTVIACIRDNISDCWMTMYEDKFADNLFIKNNILGMRTQRKRSGTARSNIWYHSFRPYITKYCSSHNVMISYASKTEKTEGGNPKQIKIVPYALSEEDKKVYDEGRKLFKSSLVELLDVIKNLAIKEINAGKPFDPVFTEEKELLLV